VSNWLLYGAYGYTGKLIVEEAVKRGHTPVLAGRKANQVADLARSYGLDHLAFSLEDQPRLDATVAEFELVFHAAGPYVHTAEPMVRACLAGRTHYLDLTGELPVYEHNFSLDQQAKDQGIILLSGVGFDVVPTDCLAVYVAKQVPGAVSLELAIASMGGVSAGTAKTTLEMIPRGGFVRRDGRYVPFDFGRGARRVRFSDGSSRMAMPIPWGDLATAFRSTGIPNITTYLSYPARYINQVSRLAPPAGWVLGRKTARRLARELIDLSVSGPDEKTRHTARSYVWARVTGEDGLVAQAWLETVEAYRFTAEAGVRSLEKVLAENPSGTLTPALAFGADFVLEIEGTRRYDQLPERIDVPAAVS
jgi:short subunit dehydrogenase-like uncharacterized protein